MEPRGNNAEWRRLQNEVLHSLYRSLNIFRMIKSRRLRRAILLFFLIKKNYNTYRDLNTRIILNNVLKVTLDIVENVFFPNEQLRAHQL